MFFKIIIEIDRLLRRQAPQEKKMKFFTILCVFDLKNSKWINDGCGQLTADGGGLGLIVATPLYMEFLLLHLPGEIMVYKPKPQF